MSLRFLLDPGCPTYINTGLLFTLSHIANLTSLLSSLRKILENLYCLSKRGVAVHPNCLLIMSSEDGRKSKLPSAEKTRVGATLASSARVKHLVGVDSKKKGGMHNIKDVPLKPLADECGDRDLLREIVRARSSSPVKRQRDADVHIRSSGRLSQSKSGGRSGRSAHPPNHHDPAVESRAVKRGVDSSPPIPLEVRLAEAKKAKESSARAKGSSATSAADPQVDKSSPAGDAGVSDLLKTHFLSSPSACAGLFDQIRQAGDLGTFSSLSLEKQREATLHLLQKGVVFAAETIRNSRDLRTDSLDLVLIL
ncbi:uncharacterized protein LOC110770152 [Prunus avium]|uniref:Uncharacterized protein LOC110770152 n=1 Tax=Prunus avium TaxID=42229 RepID=A0A6P5TSQ5_PRUAV|nr:uncharacterized protein LOC110770152 [Prunus avium]